MLLVVVVPRSPAIPGVLLAGIPNFSLYLYTRLLLFLFSLAHSFSLPLSSVLEIFLGD